MKQVRAKKHLGQHFLIDESIAYNIVEAIKAEDCDQVLEIGPGMGVLTKYLIEKENYTTTTIDIDKESIGYLKKTFPTLEGRIIEGDFLQLDLAEHFKGKKVSIIGNFPYNISSQIFFKVLDEKEFVPELVCMLQKEVAERLASPPGNRDYGILSVFLQAYYDVEYLFTVECDVFNPPPKVRSGVIRMVRNNVKQLDCDEKWFRRVVKQGFQTRRKTLRNALKPLNLPPEIQQLELLDKRAEQLSVADFVGLTQLIQD